MADTYSASLRFQLQGTGYNLNTWGTILDTQLQLIEAAITGDNGYGGGTGGIGIGGQTAFSLTAVQGTADQARQALYPFVGALVAPCTVTIPGVVKIGWALNATTGNQNVVLQVGGGASLTLKPGSGWTLFYCDGTNVTAPALAIPGLTSSGAAVFQSTLALTGAATLASTLAVTGAATLNSTLAVTGLTTTGRLYASAGITLSSVGPYLTPLNGTLTPASWSYGIAISAGAGLGMAAAGFFCASDERLKDDIRDIAPEEAAAWVLCGRPRTYTMAGKPCAGFIAQEDIAAGRGAAVTAFEDEDPRVADGDGYAPDGHRLVRDYDHDIAYLTAALQWALKRIAALEAASG